MHPKEHLQLDAVTFTSVSRQILLTLLCFISKKKHHDKSDTLNQGDGM